MGDSQGRERYESLWRQRPSEVRGYCAPIVPKEMRPRRAEAGVACAGVGAEILR